MHNSFACRIWCLSFSACGEHNHFSTSAQPLRKVCVYVCVTERERERKDRECPSVIQLVLD